MTVPGPYPDAATAVIDQVLLQVFYRQLSTVAVHFGIGQAYTSATWLSENGRGGSVNWKVPGRVFLWTGVAVAPDVPKSPTIDVWGFGAAVSQFNSVLLRKGFWTLYLAPGTGP